MLIPVTLFIRGEDRPMQKEQQKLSEDQIKAFYHDSFVEDQVRDFHELLGPILHPRPERIIDVGGGAGFFARCLQEEIGIPVSVLDSDPQSIQLCEQAGIEAELGDALHPVIADHDVVVCLNLILHHLVGKSEAETNGLQRQALSVWQPRARAIFVNEYIYESFLFKNISGRLIFLITSSALFSYMGGLVAKVIPSLKANTFGVGVRFRASDEWKEIFTSLGFDVVGTVKGVDEDVSFARRLLFIKSCRRDSFLLCKSSS